MAFRGLRVSSDLELLPGGAALIVPENALIVADLHLGCEAALEHEGLSLPRIQSSRIERYLRQVVSEVKPDTMVVAGDLKHNFSRNLSEEWQEVSRFIATFSKQLPVRVVRGNHDNYLRTILHGLGVEFRPEIKVGRYKVVHGHRKGSTDGPFLMGHLHPSVTLRDEIGASLKEPCFLFDKMREVLVLPALSLVAGGVDVVSQPSSDEISPLLRHIGLKDFVPIVFSKGGPLTFPSVGKMRELKEFR